MVLSARNRLTGEVASIERDGLVSVVVVDLPRGGKVSSVMATSSVKRLGLTVGDVVDVVVPATDVMIETDETDETVAAKGTEDMGETERSSGESGTETDSGEETAPSEHESRRVSGTDAYAGTGVGDPESGPDVGIDDPEEGRNRENVDDSE